MKKLTSIISLLAVLTVSFTGCGSKIAPKLDSKNQSTTRADGQNKDRQSFNQGVPANITGEVDLISGNSVTLKLIAMPARPNGGQGDAKPNGNPNDVKPSGNPSDAKPSGAPQSPNRGDRKTEYTGQEETITILDSIPITTFSRGPSDAQKSNVKISDIKKGDRLQVWYSDKEKKTIEKITVMPQRDSTSPSPAK